MIYQGRYVDVLSLWGEYVDLKDEPDPLPTFLSKAQCPNPEHNTTKRHFQVNTKKPLVHCFANCGISGTYEHALSMILGCTEREARRVILSHSRVPVKGEAKSDFSAGVRKSISADDELAKDERALRGGRFQWLPQEAHAFLDKRGIDGPSRGKWQIGWDEEESRLVIPAFDDRRILRFLIRQRIDGIQSAKYLYTDGSIKTSLLFGACNIDQEQLNSLGLVLCEGPLDAIRMHQMGIRSAVSILGTGLSQRQARLIDKFGPRRVFLMFDRDEAGASNITSAQMRIHKVPLFVCRYPSGKFDPAEMKRSEVERSIDRALPLAEFLRRARTVTRPRGVHVGERDASSSRS